MSKTFRIPLKEDSSVLIEKAGHAAKKFGVEFTGDMDSGGFSGRGVEGVYQIQADELTVTINKKPMLIPWAAVEKVVKEYFA